MATYKIFVSSNQSELKEERVAVKEVMLDNPTLRNFFEVFLGNQNSGDSISNSLD